MANTQQNDEWRKRELGALWKKNNGKQTFLTGKLKINNKEINVVVFANKFKNENPNGPDFRIYLSEDRQAAPAPAAAQTRPARRQPAPAAVTTTEEDPL